MESEENLENLRVLTRSMMKARKIDKYDLNIEGTNKKGENYVGDIIFFNVECENTGKKYNLVFKTCKKFEENEKLKNLPELEEFIAKLYKNEIYIYADVLPRLRLFGNEIHSCFELDFVPKVYTFSLENKHESLIMENLKSSGYRLWDRTKPMDLDHVQLVLENYGKFHAASMAFRDQKKEEFQGLITGDLLKHLPGDIHDSITAHKKDFNNGIRVLREFGRHDLAEKFEEIWKMFEDIFLTYTPDNDRLAILHGDCWNSNLMFKYEDEESSEPLKMCFLDFQFSHLDSPVKDLSYFIYTSCDESTLKHFDLLLKTYYDSFSSTLKSLGSRAQDLFTMEQLKEHWKKYSLFGLIVSTVIIKLEVGNSKVEPHTEGSEKDGKDFTDVPTFQIKYKCEYNRRIFDVFSHYAETCL